MLVDVPSVFDMAICEWEALCEWSEFACESMRDGLRAAEVERGGTGRELGAAVIAGDGDAVEGLDALADDRETIKSDIVLLAPASLNIYFICILIINHYKLSLSFNINNI